MKKSEKIISALLLMAFGVMFIVLEDSFIGILMTVAGVGFIVVGVGDIINRCLPLAIVKGIAGLLLIICGWAIVEAVLYIFSGILLVIGALLFYAKLKKGERYPSHWRTAISYATPTVCAVVGILLLFHNSAIVSFVFIVSGVLTVAEGGILLFYAFNGD